MQAIQIASTGGPEVLVPATVPEPRPGPDQVAIRVAAAGVNFIDTYHRTGIYPQPLPFVPGGEVAGTVIAVGYDVEGFGVGDVVATPAASGGYAEVALAVADRVVPVPEGVAPDVAAAVILQGLTAHYLVTDTFALRAGHRCLIHAGAGGVGLLAIQLAVAAGAEVFTTVSSDEKAHLASGAGAHHVVRYDTEPFDAAIRRIAGADRPLDVVYDGVGVSTFADGLGLIRPRGTMVLYGQSSGVVPPFDLQELNRHGSLYVTRPGLGPYIAGRSALTARAAAVLGAVAEGRLDVRIGARYPLAEAAEAHRALEGRRTTGKALLVP